MPETIKSMFRPGGVMYAVVGVIALALISGGIVVSVPSLRSEAQEMEPLTDLELAVTLTRVGLDAGPLVAAGLTATKVKAVVTAGRDHLEGSIQTLRDADAAYVSAKTDVDNLERVVRSGLATAQQTAAYGSAKAQLATAESDRKAALDDAFAAATTGLTAGQLATINAVKSARGSGWDMPLQYLAVARAEKDWVELRNALANERISASLGLTTDPEAQQLILTENANSTVSAAKTSLDANLASLTTTWNTNVYP